MPIIVNRFRQFNAVFPDWVLVWLRYAGVIALVLWIVFKLSAVESLLQSHEPVLFKNTALLLHQQTSVSAQLNRLETKLMTVENVSHTYRTLAEDIKAYQTQLDAMKATLQQIQIQTTPSVMLSTLKSAQLSLKHAVNKPSKKDRMTTRSKSLKHSIHRLPFQILNIDSWNDECLVMVNHNGHIDLLSKHDTLAGWQVAEIDFDAGWVKFKHRQGQSIRVFV